MTWATSRLVWAQEALGTNPHLEPAVRGGALLVPPAVQFTLATQPEVMITASAARRRR
jgi:hypothetical protein